MDTRVLILIAIPVVSGIVTTIAFLLYENRAYERVEETVQSIACDSFTVNDEI